MWGAHAGPRVVAGAAVRCAWTARAPADASSGAAASAAAWVVRRRSVIAHGGQQRRHAAGGGGDAGGRAGYQFRRAHGPLTGCVPAGGRACADGRRQHPPLPAGTRAHGGGPWLFAASGRRLAGSDVTVCNMMCVVGRVNCAAGCCACAVASPPLPAAQRTCPSTCPPGMLSCAAGCCACPDTVSSEALGVGAPTDSGGSTAAATWGAATLAAAAAAATLASL